jgi:dTDP-4-dehydrorhamnose 3,5-epimerase
MPFMFNRVQKLPELVIIQPKVFIDERGLFMETYKESDFVKNGISDKFKQDNHSKSIKGVLRGLHYQSDPYPQGKLVRVIYGKIWDVAVDIRKTSPTFLQWSGIELSGENKKMFYIPKGFAHGFITLSDQVHLLYKCTSEYNKDYDKGIRFDDPDINIRWPQLDYIISKRDKQLPYLKDTDLCD